MRKEPAIRILATASLLGIVGELLFHDAAWGLNILFWTLSLGAGAYGLARWLQCPIPKIVQTIAPLVAVFAACFAFREAPNLKFANGVALALLLGVLLDRTKKGSLAQASIHDLTLRVVGSWFKLTADFARLVVKDIKWIGNEEWRGKAQSIVRGSVIALPLLLLFGFLFASADDAFRVIMSRAFSFDWLNGSWLLQTSLIFCICAVIAGGTFRVLLMRQEETGLYGPPAPPTPPTGLNMTEVGVIFGLLNALFGLFVFVQAQYFFGGVHRIQTVDGLTFAQYARHGFFELSAVAGFSLITILGFHSLLKDKEKHQRAFSGLAGLLVAFVAVVLVSAFERMNLYIVFAGLTQLRVYTTAFMVWIAFVFLWLIPTVLRGQRARFAAGALATGLAAVFALNVINPDATIAQFNLNLTGRQVDLAYLESLSVDAAPAIVNGAAKLPAKDAAELRNAVQKSWGHDVDSDWRGISWARWKYLNDYRRRL